jgi:hypothetical protein
MGPYPDRGGAHLEPDETFKILVYPFCYPLVMYDDGLPAAAGLINDRMDHLLIQRLTPMSSA